MYYVFSTCLLASIQRSNLCVLCWVIFMCIYIYTQYVHMYIYIYYIHTYIYIYWLVVSTRLKNISQLGLLFPMEKKNMFQTIQAADPVFRWHQILQVVIFASTGARNAWMMISVACARESEKSKRKLCELENLWYLCCMFNWLTACQLQLYNYPWRLIVRGWNAHDTIWWLPLVASNHSQNISQLGSSS